MRNIRPIISSTVFTVSFFSVYLIPIIGSTITPKKANAIPWNVNTLFISNSSIKTRIVTKIKIRNFISPLNLNEIVERLIITRIIFEIIKFSYVATGMKLLRISDDNPKVDMINIVDKNKFCG